MLTVCDSLPTKWDSMGGSFLGRDLTLVPFLLDEYEVEDKIMSLSLLSKIIDISIEIANRKTSRKK